MRAAAIKALVGAVAIVVVGWGPSAALAANSLTPEQVADATAGIAAANLSDTAYQSLWCGAAFSMLYSASEGDADAISRAEASQLSGALYRKAVGELVDGGMSRDDFITIGQQVEIVAGWQTLQHGAPPDFTREECATAADTP